jgi:WD40 repeat protein
MTPHTLQVSKDGAQFAAFCADSRVRVWRFASGKLRRTYDESLEVRVHCTAGYGGSLFSGFGVHLQCSATSKT